MAIDDLTPTQSFNIASALVHLCGIVNQYTRSFGAIEKTSFDSGCKWTGL
jgi:hypothetical protein